MKHVPVLRCQRLIWVSVFSLLASGCAGLLPKAPPPPSFYALDGFATSTSPKRAVPAPGARPLNLGPTLIVNPPHAAAGFDSARLIYVRQAHHLQYFAHSEWVDTPARMAAPLIVAALQRSTRLSAVLLTPSSAHGDLRLDTEILRLQHDFTASPSRVRLSLRVTLVDNATRRVLAWRELDHMSVAPSEDAYGGVVAANVAWQAALADLVNFAEEAASRWQPPPPRQ